jgi:hypothetical protein
METGKTGCFWNVLKWYILYLTVLTVRSSKAPDTRVRAQSTPPGATPGRCSHSCCYSPLSRYTDLHCPDTRTHGTGRTLLYTLWVQENTEPAGHFFTLSEYTNTRHQPDTSLHSLDIRKHGTGRTTFYTVRIHEHTAPAGQFFTLSGYKKTRNRQDTFLHCPNKRTHGTGRTFKDTVQMHQHIAQAGHLLSTSRYTDNYTLSRTCISNISTLVSWSRIIQPK